LVSPMNIELSSEDLRQMPSNLSASLVNWLKSERLKPSQPSYSPQSKSDAEQLTLTLVASNRGKQKSRVSSNHTHVRLSQLFDAGFTKSGMSVRVRLKQEAAKKRGYGYITKGLSISSKGTLLYKDEEFDKPSPLAETVNGSAVNGWEYVEVMKDGQWVCLHELRKIWRNAS